MATSIAAENSTSADIRQSISRQISCLGDGSRSAKRRALEFIRKNTINKKQSIDTDVLEEIFCSDLRKPLLRCFSDPVDKCRELSIELVNEFIDILSTPGNLLPYLIPCAVQRLGQKEITESAEEIRLLLVETIFKVIEKWGEDLGLYVNDLVNIFQQTLVDPFPDVRKQSCQCVCKVARKIPQHFHLQSEALINPLLKSSSHQHSKVRADCIYTIGDVLQFGNPKPMEKVTSHLAQRLFDDSPIVRRAVTEVVGNWLLDYIDRYSYHHKLIPLLLTSQSDEIPQIAARANELWDSVGQKYVKENEEELKDELHYDDKGDMHSMGEGLAMQRPNLGCRTLIYRNLSKILPGLLNDLADWAVMNRIMAARLLRVLLLNAEDHTTQHIAKLLPGLYRAVTDEEEEVATQAIESAKLVGFFIGPDVYCMLVLPYIVSNPSWGVLRTFSAILKGTSKARLQHFITEICNTLAQSDVYCSDQMMYQVQLLACVDAIMTCCGDGCEIVSFQLFFILISLLAQTKEEPLKRKIKDSLHRLAVLQSMESDSDIYTAHAKQMISKLKGNYTNWASFSVERAIFDTVLLEAGPVAGSLLDDIMPVLLTNLNPEKDPELRLKLFSLLAQLLVNASETLDSQHQFNALVPVVVLEMILPNCVWCGGRTAAAVRTTAVSCLWALLKSGLISADQLLEMMSVLLPQATSLLEDDVRTTRLITCRVLQRILEICGTRLHPDTLHTMYMELLKRLDDSSDEIRLSVTKTFMTFFRCFQKEYDVVLYKAHIETLYRGLLVHMDDTDTDIQQAVLDVLKQAAVIHPPLLEREVEAVRQKHRSLIYCDELLQHTKRLQIS
ncbi:putative dynein assembly factor 5, axonemal [Apostichopus japonicus]|uniref:Putative dynein assembly factor 5, axonemal n=1 Tax=Stichopus japonicus TaxID=307972 RepID=A0A2G8KC10_STIJA|nr:putative dynein assembly factor 5, axonemal [Apostichopus japonicus]